MFFLCYVPFHLTAPFHTTPRGPESGDLVAHVTVIIFFNGDKDMDSRDSDYSLSSPAPMFGDSVSLLDRNEFIQSKVGPYCVQRHPYTQSHIECVHQKHAHPRKYTCRLVHTWIRQCKDRAARRQQTNLSSSPTVFALITWTKRGTKLRSYRFCFCFTLVLLFLWDTLKG